MRKVRNALNHVYRTPNIQPLTKSEKAKRDKDCLVHPYLGKRRVTGELARFASFFTIRNMILQLDQMEHLELDVKYYAEQMAEALAVIHWVVRVDGRGIEFVLGSAPSAVRRPLEEDDLSDEKLACSTWKEALNQTRSKARTAHLWVLDFDQCRHISMDNAGVKDAVEAFDLSDPYYPSPRSTVGQDQELWRVFRDQYLEKSRDIIGNDQDMRSLPATFIQQTIEKQHAELVNPKERMELDE